MTSATVNEHFLALQKSIISTQTLIESLHKTFSSSSAPNKSTTTTSPSPNPLALLSDASAILKAQTTKLSLLILNKPFTPQAITYILTSISTSCLPALASVLELCPAATHSKLLRHQIHMLLSRGFQALSNLLATIPQTQPGDQKLQERDTLTATGLLWETCDLMTEVASAGLVELATKKVDTYHNLLKDAIVELEGWDPNRNDDDDIDIDTDSNLDNHNLPMSPPLTPDPSSHIPHFLLLSLRLLRHIRLLYPALRKRRVRRFPSLTSDNSTTSSSSPAPPSPSQIRSLDTLLDSLGDFSPEADEVAGALYAGDEAEVLDRLAALRQQADSCIQSVMHDWNGMADEFSTWAQKWLELLRMMDLGGNVEPKTWDPEPFDDYTSPQPSQQEQEQKHNSDPKDFPAPAPSSTFLTSIPIR